MSTDQHIDHRPPGQPVAVTLPRAASAAGDGGVPSPRAVPLTEAILDLDRRPEPPTHHASDQRAAHDPPAPGVSAVVAEHALLGVMLVAPGTVGQVESFLGPRDFATRETRAAYSALRGLQQVGALIDLRQVAAHLRWDAAHENQLRLHAALATPGSPHHAPDIDAAGVVGAVTAAAPVDGMGLRGVFDPAAGARLGRIVLEDSCRRRLAATGLSLRRATPLVPPTRSAPTRNQRRTQALLDNLTRADQRLQVLAERLARATDHEQTTQHRPDAVSPPATAAPAATAVASGAQAPPSRSWVEPVTRVLRRRAERHLIHLALHAGRPTDVPAEVLDLAATHAADPRHAGAWQAIHALRAAGEPVNYVTVLHHLHTTAQTGPVLSDRALIAMATPPATSPARIARTLRTLATGALRDITARADTAFAVAAADRTTPVADAVARARHDVRDLTGRTRAALAQQHAAAHHTTEAAHRPDPPAAGPRRGRHRAT